MTRNERDFRKLKFHSVEGPVRNPAVLFNRPSFLPRGRPRGTKAKGLGFEKLVGKALEEMEDVTLGPWFEYTDDSGHHFCQPDLVVRAEEGIFAIEVKLTDTPEGKRQLRELYLPVLRAFYGEGVKGILVCKNLNGATQLSEVVNKWKEAKMRANGKIPTLHWLGKGPI